VGISYDALLKFLEDDGLDSILRVKVCGRKECPSGDCDGSITSHFHPCPAMAVLDTVADQICRQGRLFMETLAKDWAASQY